MMHNPISHTLSPPSQKGPEQIEMLHTPNPQLRPYHTRPFKVSLRQLPLIQICPSWRQVKSRSTAQARLRWTVQVYTPNSPTSSSHPLPWLCVRQLSLPVAIALL